MKKALKYKHTTTVPVKRTIAEVTDILVQLGATGIHQRAADREVVGIDFSVLVGDELIMYRMPIRWEPVFEHLTGEMNSKRRRRSLGKAERARVVEGLQEKAKRIAWRIALEWLKVNLAFIEIGARNAIEVFLADMLIPGTEQTIAGRMIESGATALLPETAGGKR